MAAAIIPLASAVLPIVIPLLRPVVESLVTHVEKIFGAKTGETKFQTVVDQLTPLVEALATSGKIPGTIDGVHVGSLVETVVQDLKSKGVLTPTIIPASPLGAGGTYKISGNITLSI